MKKILKKILTAFKPYLEKIASLECEMSRAWATASHRRLMAIQWRIPPQPEHFDHHIDLYYQFLTQRNPLWLERGAFGSLALTHGDVLELACGDGFNARNFYSLRSNRVIACDFDPTAIATAKRKNSAPNITYILADIRSNMPNGTFDNIVWDAAIEHFTPAEIDKLLVDMKNRLTPNGILSGYTIVEESADKKSLSHHEYEFKNKEDLLRFFKPHFKYVTVFETIYPTRHNLYFWASQQNVLPFSNEWKQAVRYVEPDTFEPNSHV